MRGAAVAAAALVLTASAGAAPATFIGFRTPSGNIGCGYWKFTGETAGFRCDIGSKLKPLPRRTAPCDGVWG